MKGVILTAGNGSRLRPVTGCYGKVLVPLYNKPMIFYAISLLVKCSIRDIIIVVNKQDKRLYQHLLSRFRVGISIKFVVQSRPLGTAHALKCARAAARDDGFVLLFGDNVFIGDMPTLVQDAINHGGVTLFAKRVYCPQNFGVITLDKRGNILGIEEKPKQPKSNYVATGLYVLPNSVLNNLCAVKKSVRGEYEFSDIIGQYVRLGQARATLLDDDITWLDTGTFDTLLKCSECICDYEEHNGIYGCPEVDMYNNGYIDYQQLLKLIEVYPDSFRQRLLASIINK